MRKFVCKNCNYRFESSSEKRLIKCPYCGNEKASEELNAEELLKDE